jgi:hypothetical protein
MTGAGRLSSGPQPVTANAAPLCLSCTFDRRRQCVSALAAASVRDGSLKGEKPAQAGVSAPADSPVPKGNGHTLTKKTP